MYTLEKGEFAIILSSLISGDKLNIKTGLTYTLHEDDQASEAMFDMATMCLAFIELIEEDEELYEYVADHRMEVIKRVFPDQYANAMAEIEAEEKEPKFTKEGNVLTLSAWSKTKGNA